MKATITFLCMGLILFQLKAQNLTLSGKVDDHITKVTLSVFNPESLTYDRIDQTEVQNGAYRFQISFDQPNLFQVDFAGAKKVTLSYTNESQVELHFRDGRVEIYGSPSSEDMQQFERQNGELQAKHFAQLKADADKAMQSGNQEAMAEIQKRSELAIRAFLPELRNWIESKGVGPAGYYALQYSDFNKELDYISNHLVKFQNEIPESPITKALAAQVYRSKVLNIGQVPPSFEAQDSKGRGFSFENYRGKVLLLDFWAAWCRACRIENPQFVELYNEFNSKGLEIVSISQDRDAAVWKKAMEKDGVAIWANIQDSSREISVLYSVSSLPQNLVIGKDGRIIAKNVTAEELKTMLQKAL